MNPISTPKWDTSHQPVLYSEETAEGDLAERRNMTNDWLPEPAGVTHRGEVVFVREGEGSDLWTVIKLGFPEYTRGPMTFEDAKSYWGEIK